jgi:hypothetical protein
VGDSALFRGTPLPTRELTLGSGLSLFRHRVRVAAQADYRGGQTLNNPESSFREEGAFPTLPNAREANDPSAPLEAQARAVAAGTFLGTGLDVSPADFVRLRELSVTYVAPDRLAHAVHARTASVTLAGRNLALWTRYRGTDPEVNAISAGTPTDFVTDQGVIPQVRSWALRLNLGL